MSDTKILQAILDGQRALKEELSGKIDKVDKKVGSVKEEVLENRKRIDMVGYNLAELSDDAPTVEEFGDLKNEVTKIQKHLAIS